MTTLAIIGSGIAGRSLIYTLAKEEKSFEKITVFYSDSFTFPCAIHSTAIVAPRGLSSGHSPLGDSIMAGFNEFSRHVELDAPAGIQKIIQYTGATEKLDQFKKRYPNGSVQKLFLTNETYIATEQAYLIDPTLYTNWLLSETQSMEKYHLELIEDLVIDVEENERVHIKTQDGRSHSFDKVIFAGGNYNRFWTQLAPTSKLKSSKPVQGSYYQFDLIQWDMDSFSLTLDGDNLIWNRPLKRLLVGSTTEDKGHVLPPMEELTAIYQRISNAVTLELPPIEKGEIKVGLREKAQKREPYLFQEGHKIFIGGLYKNGYTLSLKMAKDLSRQFL
ncbi:FAD-dependent oxidoreductase [Peredibacter starrii]|uniref:FAD-dependent oxidoreductase n=1 Tax=Peredibacter starrii TaxID=28202 RepID=A0AAX4HK99_9BACT|nr:FAD-dependent oxidoreductase [Peredibacter starrii]WPU63631.1 FAD-dependent oxidoreductase [Peredibacter starrii]